MNFPEALLCIALTASIGCFHYFFYELLKKEKDEKKEPDGKDNPLRMTKRDRKPTPAGKTAMANASQGENSIATQIFGDNHGNVNVVNITNYPLGSGQDLKSEQDANTNREMKSFSEMLGETQETTPTGKNKKRETKVYFLDRAKEEQQKASPRSRRNSKN